MLVLVIRDSSEHWQGVLRDLGNRCTVIFLSGLDVSSFNGRNGDFDDHGRPSRLPVCCVNSV